MFVPLRLYDSLSILDLIFLFESLTTIACTVFFFGRLWYAETSSLILTYNISIKTLSIVPLVTAIHPVVQN